jgi:hypothetical protein
MGKGGGLSIDFPSFKKFSGDLLNAAFNLGTVGLVGYDANSGKVDKGVVTHAVDEGVGELTGRNQAREALNRQSQAIDEEKRAREIEDQNRQLQNFRMDVAASRSAAAIRNTAQARGSAGSIPAPSAVNNKLGADERDFLGT